MAPKKVIEAMNELKLIEKRLTSKLSFLERFAARPSIREDSFGGKEKDKVNEAIQSCVDLVTEYERLKRTIDFTNLWAKTSVKTAGKEKEHTLHSLILHKRVLCSFLKKIYAALDDRRAHSEVEQIRARQATDAKLNIQVVHNYDIAKRDEAKVAIDELEASIDSSLQIANSKLEVIDPDQFELVPKKQQ